MIASTSSSSRCQHHTARLEHVKLYALLACRLVAVLRTDPDVCWHQWARPSAAFGEVGERPQRPRVTADELAMRGAAE